MRTGRGANAGSNPNAHTPDASETIESHDADDADDIDAAALKEVLRKASAIPHKKGGKSEMLIIPGWALDPGDDYIS